MGFEHWIMQNFWLVIVVSLVFLVAGHFAVVWLLQQGKTPQAATKPKLGNDDND